MMSTVRYLLCTLALVCFQSPGFVFGQGVVIEKLTPFSVLEEVGLQPGDLILSWERLPNPPQNPEPGFGRLESPFDWFFLEAEQVPRGTIILEISRAEASQKIEVKPGFWGAKVRPKFDTDILPVYLQGKTLIEEDQIEAGVALWNKLLAEIQEPGLRAWLSVQIGEAWTSKNEWGLAESAFNSAPNGSDQARLTTLVAIGIMRHKKGDLAGSIQAFRDATSHCQAVWGKSLVTAKNLDRLAYVLRLQGQTNESLKTNLEAFEIRKYLAPGSLVHAESLNNLSVIYRHKGFLGFADDHAKKARGIIDSIAPNSALAANIFNNLGNIELVRDNYQKAEAMHRKALEIREKHDPRSHFVASSLNNLGVIAKSTGNWKKAVSLYEQALKIYETTSPESLDVADTLINLGVLNRSQGDLKASINYYLKAYQILKKQSPSGLAMADCLNNLGNVYWDEGLLDQALDYYQDALAIKAEHAPNSLAFADTLNNIGLIGLDKSDFDWAHHYFQQALTIQEKLAPGGYGASYSLNNLGAVAEKQNNYALAMHYYERSLKIVESRTPFSLDVASTLSNMAQVDISLGKFDKALERLRIASEIQEKQAPRSLDRASTLFNLGNLELKRKNYQTAISYMRKSLEIREEIIPESLTISLNYHHLGSILAETNRLQDALFNFEKALDIRLKQAPQSGYIAGTAFQIARINENLGNLSVANKFFKLAIDSLDSQHLKMAGSSHFQLDFRSRTLSVYQGYIRFLVSQRKYHDAIAIQEMSRARLFHRILLSRSLKLSTPEIDQEFDQLSFQIEKAQAKLASVSSTQNQEQDNLLKSKLLDLRTKYDLLLEKVQEETHTEKSIWTVSSLNCEEIQTSLDPKTTVLSYSVLPDRTIAFAISNKTIICQTLDLAEEGLREKIEAWRNLVRDQGGSVSKRLLWEKSKELYEDLIQPFYQEIDVSNRLVVIPDGPLFGLSFSSLVTSIGKDGHPQFLIESKPISTVASATILKELHGRPKAQLKSLVLFGNPVYPQAEKQSLLDKLLDRVDFRTRSFYQKGQGTLEPLPGTANEVNAIMTKWGEGSQGFLGAEATEARLKSLDGNVDILHFACHGFFDEQTPLDSALALTINQDFQEGEENGILQGWEIIEKGDLDVELVILSACNTAMGKNYRGEGMVGLTRAFQYAGARSILASSWEIRDATTAVFMERFYTHLLSAIPKNEALQRTQVEFITKPIKLPRSGFSGILGDQEFDASHPYYWAAFQLIGPWD